MMFKSKKQWRLLHPKTATTMEELIDVLLYNRGIPLEQAETFFNGDGTLHSPFLFREMEKAVERIHRAVQRKEQVVIYGDYDVDGVTGTAILIKALRRLGLEPRYYIPHRFTEGYGPNREAFQHFIESGVDLIITVDNGITGVKEAKLLKDHGVDLIITDHHEPKDELPDAYAILHPRLSGETYPFSDLSGSGVSYKLACALLGEEDETLIDLACLGTYADIVSVLGENRTLLKRGIKRLMVTSHKGLLALRQVAKIDTINEFALGFIYGPRLNAPGRMDHAELAVELLITEDMEQAYDLAETIERLNQERKHLIDQTFNEACALVDTHYQEDPILVVHRPHWHEGILGIVASRLVDHYGKPSIVLTTTNQGYKGSARSIPNFSLVEHLEPLKNYFVHFGGHKMAAGLTVKPDALEDFRLAINRLAGTLRSEELRVECKLDVRLLNEAVVHLQERLRPFGPDNQRPRYLFEDAEVVEVRTVGADGQHLRLQVALSDQVFTCIGFGFGAIRHEITEGDRIDLVAELELNTYLDQTNVQLRLVDLRSDDIQLYDYRTKYFDPAIFEPLQFQPVYFKESFNYPQAVAFDQVTTFHPHVLLIDLPEREEDLRTITNQPHLSKLLVLFRNDEWLEELLLKRDHFVKCYATYRKLQRFFLHDPKLMYTFKQHGITKRMHELALQVFLELGFVIIRGDEVIVIENPDKRDLMESPTYQRIRQALRLKNFLTLSSTKELKTFLFPSHHDNNKTNVLEE